MAVKPKKNIQLIHGDCDYLIFKRLKEVRKEISEKNISITEFDGSKNLSFEEIQNTLQSSDLFMNSSAVIIRDINNGKTFFPFVEDLVNYLQNCELKDNGLYVFHFGKVLKTSKIYKSFQAVGSIEEITQPKPNEILKSIKTMVNITDEAAVMLLQLTNSNLFLIRNEVRKIQNYLNAQDKTKADITDIEKISINMLSQNDVWGIGSKFLDSFLNPHDNRKKRALMLEVEDILRNETPVMQILYSFYQNVLSAVKFKQAMNEGKVRSQRDAYSFGYFFARDFFSQKDKLDYEKLMELNSKLLSIEFQIKSGEMDEVMGIRRLILGV